MNLFFLTYVLYNKNSNKVTSLMCSALSMGPNLNNLKILFCIFNDSFCFSNKLFFLVLLIVGNYVITWSFFVHFPTTKSQQSILFDKIEWLDDENTDTFLVSVAEWLRCSMCNKVLCGSRSLKQHISCVHATASAGYQCKYCFKIYKNKHTLFSHISQYHKYRYETFENVEQS